MRAGLAGQGGEQGVGFEQVREALPLFDIAHIKAQTFEDEALEREVLALFLEQLHEAEQSALRQASDGFLHKLKGSADGVGAFALAHQCAKLERAPGDTSAWIALGELLGRTRGAVLARLAGQASPA